MLDTDVWSHLFIPKRRPVPEVQQWQRSLIGAQVVVAMQTRAEVLVGASDLGEQRAQDVLDRLDATPTAPVDEAVIVAFARLTIECRPRGHALAAKDHTGDRWIAATAVALRVPLLARDRIYQNAPLLQLLEE